MDVTSFLNNSVNESVKVCVKKIKGGKKYKYGVYMGNAIYSKHKTEKDAEEYMADNKSMIDYWSGSVSTSVLNTQPKEIQLEENLNEAIEVDKKTLYKKAVKELGIVGECFGVGKIGLSEVNVMWDGIHGIICECSYKGFSEYPMIDREDFKELNNLKTIRRIGFGENNPKTITIYIKHESEV